MEHIIYLADKLIAEYGGKTVFETAENSGIMLWFRKLGRLKGFYMAENGYRYIIINKALDKQLQKTVCAHELGHDVLHRELSVDGIREHTLFLENNRTERDANLFAAELLVKDEDILSELQYCDSIDALSFALDVPPEIISYKFELLNFKGYNFNIERISSDFLKPQ